MAYNIFFCAARKPVIVEASLCVEMLSEIDSSKWFNVPIVNMKQTLRILTFIVRFSHPWFHILIYGDGNNLPIVLMHFSSIYHKCWRFRRSENRVWVVVSLLIRANRTNYVMVYFRPSTDDLCCRCIQVIDDDRRNGAIYCCMQDHVWYTNSGTLQLRMRSDLITYVWK